MADFSAWGPEASGPRQAMFDQQKVLLNDLGAIKTVGDIRMQPAEQAMKEAHARLYGAQASELERDAAIIAGAKISSVGEGTDTEHATRLRQLGRLLLDGGSVEKGRKLIEAAELIELRQARADQQHALTGKAQLDTQLRGLEFWGNLARSVKDQAGLDEALLFGAETIGNIPDARLREQAVQMLRRIPRNYKDAAPMLERLASSMERRTDQIRIHLGEADIALKARGQERADRTAQSQEDVNAARIRALEAQIAARERAGVAAPDPKREVEPARDFIKNQLGKKSSATPTDLNIAARELAAAAKDLQRTSPRLTYPQALAQAYPSIDIITEPPVSIAGREIPWTGGRQRPARLGEAKGKPLPAPAYKEDVIPGKWYVWPDGHIEQAPKK